MVIDYVKIAIFTDHVTIVTVRWNAVRPSDKVTQFVISFKAIIMTVNAKSAAGLDVSASLYEQAQKSLCLGVSSGMRKSVTPVPVYVDGAEGPYYDLADGRRLLDYTLAWGPLILGSAHKKLTNAVKAQLDVGGYTYGAQHRGEIELAELLVHVLPGVDQVIFSNTGSEAVQAALRIARAGTGRDLIVKFEGHYHGWFNNVLVSYHPTESQPSRATPTCGGQPQEEYADTIVLPWNDLGALAKAFADYPDKIAAVLTEPLLANSGCCVADDGYLQGIIDLCREHGAYSVFDEVITGFRMALGGAREFYGVRPDLSVYAKAIAGGFPLAAVGGTYKSFAPLREGKTIHAGTYNGNCIAIAAGIATVTALREPGVFDCMHAHGRAIREHAEREAADRGIKMISTGVGTVFGLHFGIDQPPRDYADVLKIDASLYTTFRSHMFDRGVQLLPEGRWYVGAAHGEKELVMVKSAISASFDAISS